MRINGFSGTNTQTGTMGMTQGNDSVSKNIQNQIANAQQKLQDLSSNEEMSLEDKMKKRQEIQQEINNLNQQLRQHQIEQRKEQQSKIRHLWMIWWLEQVTLTKRRHRIVTGKYAGDDLRRFFHETGKGAGKYGNTDTGTCQCA